MTKGKWIGRIVLVALGGFIIWLSVRALTDVPEYRKVLGSAVYLDKAVVLPENEGKVVIIHGKPEMLAPAYDEELGITLNSIKAYRYEEEYKLTSAEHSNNVYTWVSRGQKGIVGEAVLGEFKLDEKILLGFPADSDYEDFDSAEVEANGYNTSYGKTEEGATTERLYVIVGGPEGEAYYYKTYEYSNALDIPYFMRTMNENIAYERSGTKAYAYKVFAGAVAEEVTVAGVQRGYTLVAHEKLGSIVMNGVLSRKELTNAESGFLMGGSAVFLVIGLMLVFLGMRKNTNKENKAKRKKG